MRIMLYLAQRGEKNVVYQALYRTWRPRKFAQLIGQDPISRTLVNALTRDKLSHAYLFCGPRGTGKTSTAKILACAVNCENPVEAEPCGLCPSCFEITAGQAVDVLEIDAASNRGIDEIRDLRDKVRYAPARLKVKVYIIDEVHMLTPEAFNALLKTLEEPPGRVLFILATTEPHKLPATILSRCQRFDFFPLSVQDIASHLALVAEQEGQKASQEALLTLARSAGGGMRDALSLLEQALAFCEGELREEDVLQVLGQAGFHYFLSLAANTAVADAGACVNIIDAVVREGKDIHQFSRDLLAFFRDLAMTRAAPEDQRLLAGYSPEKQQALREKAMLFSPEALLEITEEVNRILGDMKWSEQPRLILEVGLFRICHLPPRLTLADALERITALEDQIAAMAGSPPRVQAESKTLPPAGLKKEGKGMIEKEKAPQAKQKIDDQPAEPRQGAETMPHISLEESIRAWREVLKKVEKEKPMLNSLLKDSYVAEVRKDLWVIAFRKNSEFCSGMLERRRADKTFLEFLLKRIVDRDIALKISKEAVAVADGSPPKAGSVPEEKEGSVPLPPEEPEGAEKAESEDLLVESARDIFNGNMIE
jgi:DNA polymerase III subunit gamma/tau